jgi:hypothetical protein
MKPDELIEETLDEIAPGRRWAGERFRGLFAITSGKRGARVAAEFSFE